MVGEQEHRLAITDRFPAEAMQAFMRREDIYWPGADALSPSPEQVDFVSYMADPNVYTYAGTHNGQIFGYVQFVKRTSVGAEVHAGFHPQYRGIFAKRVGEAAIAAAWDRLGLCKLWAPIPSDNHAALAAARLMGFRQEGRITRAICRRVEGNGPPLADLVIYSLSRKGAH